MDEVEVTFGLKASSDLAMLVVTRNGTEASYSVKLRWNRVQLKGNATYILRHTSFAFAMTMTSGLTDL